MNRSRTGTRLVDQLIRHEGVRLFPYHCPAGALTIGVGRNLEAKGISRREAINLLRRDIADAEHDLANILHAAGVPYKTIEGPRYEALVNMCFNMGAASLKQFRRMFAAIRVGDWEEAAAEMLNSKYARDVGSRAVELSIQLKDGDYQR